MFETTNQMIYHDIHPFSDTALWELPHAHQMVLACTLLLLIGAIDDVLWEHPTRRKQLHLRQPWPDPFSSMIYLF